MDCSRSGALSRLADITLSVPGASFHKSGVNTTDVSRTLHFTNFSSSSILPATWSQSIVSLLASSPLRNFHIYATGGRVVLPEAFSRSIVDAHRTRLTRFSVHRMIVSSATIRHICETCVDLEELFVHIDQLTFVSTSTISRQPLLLPDDRSSWGAFSVFLAQSRKCTLISHRMWSWTETTRTMMSQKMKKSTIIHRGLPAPRTFPHTQF
jgi:hypothetical protein